MTEDHAKRVREGIAERCAEFARAEAAGDWAAARKAWQSLLFTADSAIRESVGGRIEADSLAAELATHRPARGDQPPAPRLDGWVYVHTNGPWVCAATEHRKTVVIQGLPMVAAYSQDHYVPDPKTACGKKTLYPVSERFASGGWPRMREVCPECVGKLAHLFAEAS